MVGILPESIDPREFTIANSCGNNSEGPDFWQSDLRKAVAEMQPGQLLIASVVGTIKPGFGATEYYDDFATTAEMAAGCGAPVIELNLSCPNVAGEGVMCYDIRGVIEICRRTKERIGDIPLLIKIGYFSATQEELLRDLLQGCANYIAGVSAINTIAAPVVDGDGQPAFPGPGREKAGISGSAVKWAGLDMAGRLKALREVLGLSFVIIGTGGVMTPEDYRDYIQVGADAVQAATGAMWNPDLAHEIKRALQRPHFIKDLG